VITTFVSAADVMAKVSAAAASGEPPRRFSLCGTGGAFGHVEVAPGQVALLGGAPGSGKTALVMQWAVEALRLDPNLRAVVLNVEMTPESLVERQLARLSGLPLKFIRGQAVPSDRAAEFEAGRADLASVADRLAFVAGTTMASATGAADAFGADLLVVDYVQRVRPAADAGDSRAAVNALMGELRRVAACGVAVVAVAAVGRQKDDAGRSGYTHLGLASFRESSELEYGADSAYILRPAGTTAATLACVKNRHGELADVQLSWDGGTQRFGPAGPAAHAPADLAKLFGDPSPGGEGGDW